MRGHFLGTHIRQLFVFVLALLLLSQLAMSLVAWSRVEATLRPELERKAATVGNAVAGTLARAVEVGVPFERLVGVGDYFDDILADNRDLAYLVVADRHGQVLAASGISAELAAERAADGAARRAGGTADGSTAAAGDFVDTATAVGHGDRMLGTVHVGVNRSYIGGRITEMRYDVAVVLLASLLIGFEVLLFLVATQLIGPAGALDRLLHLTAAGDTRHRVDIATRGAIGALATRLNAWLARVDKPAGADTAPLVIEPQRVVAVRILTLLFMFSEMLSRAFMPLYGRSFAANTPGLPADLAASLPIVAFMLCVALAMPLAGRWSDRVGRRRSYLTGALIGLAALAGTGLAPDFYTLLAARALLGVGYATMFMACQGYVIDNTGAADRGQGIAVFVGAIMVAELCAPAVGGVLADRVGYRAVFFIAAAVAALAALLAAGILDNRSARPPAGASGSGLRALLRNRRFLALAVFAGVPAKLLHAGFLVFLVPLILTDLASTKAEIGRYAMLYGLAGLSLGSLFARLADRRGAHALLVAGGGALSGIGLLAIVAGAGVWAVLGGIAALGIGQAMSIPAQTVLVTQAARHECERYGNAAVLGTFRLIERLGAAAGPLLAGLLIAPFGTTGAMAGLGALSLAGALLYLLVYLHSRRSPLGDEP